MMIVLKIILVALIAVGAFIGFRAWRLRNAQLPGAEANGELVEFEDAEADETSGADEETGGEPADTPPSRYRSSRR